DLLPREPVVDPQTLDLRDRTGSRLLIDVDRDLVDLPRAAVDLHGQGDVVTAFADRRARRDAYVRDAVPLAGEPPAIRQPVPKDRDQLVLAECVPHTSQSAGSAFAIAPERRRVARGDGSEGPTGIRISPWPNLARVYGGGVSTHEVMNQPPPLVHNAFIDD